MRSLFRFSLATIAALAIAVAAAQAGAAPESKADGAKGPPPAILTKRRAYTLAECLALADRNHPNLWAARSRLAGFRAQLDEARWTPFWQWTLDAKLGSVARLTGVGPYTSTKAEDLNTTFSDGFLPWFRMGISGGTPVYTFGKIDSIGRAAAAQVRVGEWDSEKARQQTRFDVRRAYYGAMMARDARYLFEEILDKIDKTIETTNERIAKGEGEEIDRLRLEFYRDDLKARASEPEKGETFAMASLRFMTGIQTDFEIPDEPMSRPEVPVAPVVSYLTAARLFRPDVNQARAGIAARTGQLDFARAKLFPDLGFAWGAGYSTAPSAVVQNGWVANPFNGFGFGGLIGARWALDIMPGMARVANAEAQLEEIRATERLALGGIAVEVENAYGIVIETRRREETWARAERRSKTWISSVQSAIDLGTKDERALLEPLRLYAGARSNHITALMDYNVALSDLARVSGWDSAAPAK